MLTHSELKNSLKIKGIQDKIVEITAVEKQLKDRYGINYSGLLLYSDESIDINICRGFVRESDIVRSLASNLLLVVYRVVDHQGAMKATENLLNAYQSMHRPQDLYTVLSSMDEEVSLLNIEYSLIQLLRFSVSEKKLNNIITMHDMI